MTPNTIQYQKDSFQDNRRRLKLAIDMLLDYWLQSNTRGLNNEQKEGNGHKTIQDEDNGSNLEE